MTGMELQTVLEQVLVLVQAFFADQKSVQTIFAVFYNICMCHLGWYNIVLYSLQVPGLSGIPNGVTYGTCFAP